MIRRLKVLIFAALVAVCAANSINAGNTAAIVVDVQGCFTELKNGSLAVGGTGADYLASVQDAVRRLKAAAIPVYATQDWHPAGHVSFASTHGKKPFVDTLELTINGKPHTQALWPDHCVQHTDAANILVDNSLFTAIIQKGTDPKYDSYSGFEDDNGKKTQLESLLRKQGITNLFVFGLATDYCVKATALDAKKAGFDVTVVTGLSRGVAPETTEKALEEMKAAGIKVIEEMDYSQLNELTPLTQSSVPRLIKVVGNSPKDCPTACQDIAAATWTGKWDNKVCDCNF